jgi:hypothetical protein
VTNSPLEQNSPVADDNFFLKENRRLRQLLAIYRRPPGLQLPESIADQLDRLRIELAPRMAVRDVTYSRFVRPLKQALWAARELGEKVLVIACDKRSADECVRMLRAYANEDVARPLLNVNRHDYLEFANKGSIRIVTVGAGSTPLVGLRIDSIIEVL